MIRIVITKTIDVPYTETVNFTTEEVATGQMKSSDYSNKQEPIFNRKFEPREVTKTRSVTTELLEQNIDDDKLDLVAVIKAINGIA